MDVEKLSLGVIEDLKRKGFNQSEIAEMFDKTRQAVSWHKVTYHGYRSPREVVMDSWPLQVPRSMGQTSPFRRLRDHGEYVATGGFGMPEDKLQRLRSWYKRMETHVLEFDPSIPPEDGVSVFGGWAYRSRLPEDGDLLLRDNEYCNLDHIGRSIWRMPPERP